MDRINNNQITIAARAIARAFIMLLFGPDPDRIIYFPDVPFISLLRITRLKSILRHFIFIVYSLYT